MERYFHVREYLAILHKWVWLIVLGMVLAGGTAFLLSKSMTPSTAPS